MVGRLGRGRVFPRIRDARETNGWSVGTWLGFSTDKRRERDEWSIRAILPFAVRSLVPSAPRGNAPRTRLRRGVVTANRRMARMVGRLGRGRVFPRIRDARETNGWSVGTWLGFSTDKRRERNEWSIRAILSFAVRSLVPSAPRGNAPRTRLRRGVVTANRRMARMVGRLGRGRVFPRIRDARETNGWSVGTWLGFSTDKRRERNEWLVGWGVAGFFHG